MTNLLKRATETLTNAGPDAVLTHHTALALHGCQAAERATVHILVPHRRRVRAQPGTTIHHGKVAGHDIETLYNLRVLAIEPAMAEVLCRGKPPLAMDYLARHPPDLREHLATRVAAHIKARPDPRGRKRALTLLSATYRLS